MKIEAFTDRMEQVDTHTHSTKKKTKVELMNSGRKQSNGQERQEEQKGGPGV